MKDIANQNYYEILEIEPNATQEEVLKAYNRARATYGNNSPALYSLFSKEEAQELLRLIDEAYVVLSNQFKRKQYDQGKSRNHFDSEKSEQTQKPKETSLGEFAIPSASEIGEFLPDEIPTTAAENLWVSKKNTGSSAQTSTPPAQMAVPSIEPTLTKPGEVQFGIEPRDNTGRTRFGTYRIDKAYEDEIKNIQDFSGPALQKIRLYKNITLDQISEVTKISRTYLISLENNDYPCLPASVFIRGFLVQVAKILELDGNKVATSYLKIMKEATKS